MATKGTYPKGEAKREEILQAAMTALATSGYRNISLRAIGQELGIDAAHILYYFGSRETLLEKVVERWDRVTADSHDGRLEPAVMLDNYAAAIRENLRRPGIVHLYLTFAAEASHPEHSAHDYFVARFARTREYLRAAIKHEQDAGIIDASLDPHVEAQALTALADGLQLQAAFDASIDAPGGVQAAVSALRDRTDATTQSSEKFHIRNNGS